MLDDVGIDALIACRPENLRYLLGALPPSGQRPGACWAVLPADPAKPIGAVWSEADLIALPAETVEMVEARSHGPDAFLPAADPLTGEAIDALRERIERSRQTRLPDAPAALDGLLDALALDGAQIAFDDPAALIDLDAGVLLRRPTGADLFRRIRAVKTGPELARLRACAEANATAVRAALTVAEPRRSWREVGDAWRREMASAGAEWAVWESRLAGDLVPPARQIVARHDPIGVLAAGALDGYWSEIGRAAFVGDRLPKAEKAARMLSAAFAAFVPALVPGTPIDSLVRAYEEAVAGAGAPLAAADPIRGMGLERAELPAVGDTLEPGNVVVVSFAYRELGWASLTLAEPLRIDERGAARLCDLPLDLLLTRG
ncbi:MAG: hypothetical protein U0556_15180 [Dehalococcoidia bacterium]